MGEIMIVVTTAILLLLLMLSVVGEKNIYNPMTVFLALWSVICFLAGLKLFGMYDYSYHAPLVILIGVVSVYLGYVFFIIVFLSLFVLSDVSFEEFPHHF